MKKLATLLAIIACALPAAAQSDETAKRFHLLPHLADGGGWRSVLLVTNVSGTASPCTLQLYGDLSLDRFEDAGGVTAAGSTATFELAAAGGYLVWSTKSESALASGYVTLDCVNPVIAQVVFAAIDASGAPTGMATVFSSQAATVFQFPVLRPEATLGFAIANDTNAEVSCSIVLEDPQRTNLGEATLPVPAKSNRVQLLNTAITIPETFLEGLATVSCDQQVAMIGLHFELRPDGTIITFSTLPPAILSTIPGSPTQPTPTPTGPRQSFGAGTWIVNEDIAPGRYFTNPSSGCFWERLSGTTGAFSDILANEFISFDSGQEIVDIASSDCAFKPDHECGMWSQTPVSAPAAGSIPPGRWLVGQQIPAGQYETNASSGCYWERLRGFSSVRDVIANDFVSGGGRQIITILASDEGFYSDDDCGTWSRRTGSAQVSSTTDRNTIERNLRMYRAKSGLR